LPYKDLDKGVELDLISPYRHNTKRSVANTSYMGLLVSLGSVGNFKRSDRDKRNVHIRELKARDSKFCVSELIANYPITQGTFLQNLTESYIPRSNGTTRQDHHTGEITVTKPDGGRYVYGIPA